MISRTASMVSRRCGAGRPYSTPCQVSFRRLTPAPRPRRKRPPDISSMSRAVMARMNGLRVKAHAIPVPTPTRSVAAAIQVACVTELRKSSGVQMQSMPAASAARASSVRSAAVIPIAAIETRPSASGAKRLDALDDRAGAEAAAAAHRHEAYLLVRALELVQEGGD